MAVHSGKKVTVLVKAAQPLPPQFNLSRPMDGIVYELYQDMGGEIGVLSDLSISVTRHIVLSTDIRVSIAREVEVFSDVMLAVARPVETLADVSAIITRQTALLADMRACVVRGVDVRADTRLAVIRFAEAFFDILISVEKSSPVTPLSATRPIGQAIEFLGKGLRFPFAFQRRSGGTRISTATSSDHAHIHESIRQILGTKKGERFMRPDFGTRLHELVFEPNDGILYGLIRHEVIEALDEWEPRIIVTEVLVGPDDTDYHLVLANIRYRLISSQVEGNLVYPFYRELE